MAAAAADAGLYPQPEQPADRYVDNEAKEMRVALTRFIGANYSLRCSFIYIKSHKILHLMYQLFYETTQHLHNKMSLVYNIYTYILYYFVKTM